MNDQVLSTLYVDVVARDLDATVQGVRRLAGQAEETGKAFRRMKEEIADAGSATRQVSPTSGGPVSRWGRQSSPVAPRPVGDIYSNTPTAFPRPPAPVVAVSERPQGPIATGPSLQGGFNPAASRPVASTAFPTKGGLYTHPPPLSAASRPADAVGGLNQLAAATQAAAALRQVTGASGAKVSAGVVSSPTRPQAAGGGGNSLGQVKELAGMLPGALGRIAGAATPLAAVSVALESIVGLVQQGLSGTVEIEQFGNAVLQIGRELAGLVAPALQLATSLLNQMTAAFRGTGAEGQTLLSMLSGPTGIGVFFEVLADPSVVASVKQLGAAFAELVTAAQPLIVVAANIASDLLKAFVVEPLVLFVTALTEAVKLMTEFAKQAVDGQSAILGLVGMQDLLKARGKNRREVNLNQTGTEDAQGTFQRIQQAVLKFGQEPEKNEQLTVLEKMEAHLNNIKAVVEALIEAAKAPAGMIPGAIAGGVAAGDAVADLATLGPIRRAFGIQ